MSNSIAKVLEISADSTVSFDDALKAGIARASKTVDGIQGAWIKDQEVVIEGGKITKYRLRLMVTFALRD